jgi:hypothetical protein
LGINKCSNRSFGNIKEDFLKEDGILNYICLDPITNLSINTNIKGTWSGSEFRWLSIAFRVCNNLTDNLEGITCAPKEEIVKEIEGNFFTVALQNTLINFKDYKNPIQNYVISKYTSVSTKFYKEKSFYFRNVKLTTDSGLLTQSI